MNELEKDIEILLTKELTQKKGGSIGSVIGRLVGKISPLVIKHALNILGTLGLAGISGAISGSTHRATAGRGIGQYVEYGLMLTPNQKKKLGSAQDGITLRLTKDQLAPYPSHTHTQPKATRNCFGDSVLLRVTGLVMQKLEELESNARPLAATGSRGAAINPHCATMGLQGKANAIGNNSYWLVKSRN